MCYQGQGLFKKLRAASGKYKKDSFSLQKNLKGHP